MHTLFQEVVLLMSLVVACGCSASLVEACKVGDVEQVKELLEAGADPNSKDEEYGRTCLIYAACQGNKEVADLLLANGAAPNGKDNDGQTALSCAASLWRNAVAKLLLDRGADLSIADKSGFTPLMRAAEQGNEDLAEQLLKAGADPNIQNLGGYTALMLAVRDRLSVALVKLLLEYGADPAIVNAAGDTALVLAIPSKTDILDAPIIGEQIVELLQPMNRPAKSAFVSFQHNNDKNDALTKGSFFALLNKIPAVVTTYLVKNLIEKFPLAAKYLTSAGATWSFFINEQKTLCVLIPQAGVDTELLRSRYGLYHVKRIEPNDVLRTTNAIEISGQEAPYYQLLDHVKDVIDGTSKNHPTRIYLSGHGLPGIVAALSQEYLEKMFSLFVDLDTEFLYINSCYAAGQNLVEMQKDLQTIIEKQLKANLRAQQDVTMGVSRTTKGINFAICLQVAADVLAFGQGDLNTFFTRLNEHFDKRGSKQFMPKELAYILQPLPHGDSNLQSIRLPGTLSFFRAVDLGHMEVVTWLRLQSLRFGRFLPWASPILKNYYVQLQQKDAPRITFSIDPAVNYIQVFPSDLSDVAFNINNSDAPELPKFVSKIPGQGQHFIGVVSIKSKKTLEEVLDSTINRSFATPFKESVWQPSLSPLYFSNKCWFIRSLTLEGKDGLWSNKNMVIVCRKIKSKKDIGPEYKYEISCAMPMPFEGGRYLLITGKKQRTVSKEEFIATIKQWAAETVPSHAALYEATGGNELSYTPSEKTKLLQEKKIRQADESTCERALRKFIKSIEERDSMED